MYIFRLHNNLPIQSEVVLYYLPLLGTVQNIKLLRYPVTSPHGETPEIFIFIEHQEQNIIPNNLWTFFIFIYSNDGKLQLQSLSKIKKCCVILNVHL